MPPLTVEQRRILGLGLIALGASMRAAPVTETVVITAPPRGMARVLYEMTQRVIDAARDAIEQIDAALALAQDAYNQLVNLRGQLTDLRDAIDGYQAFLEELLRLVQDAQNTALAVRMDLEEALRRADALADQLTGPARTEIQLIMNLLQDALDRIRTLQTQLDEIRRRLEQALNAIRDLKAIIDNILNAFDTALNTLGALAQSLEATRQALNDVIDAMNQLLPLFEEVSCVITVGRGQSVPFRTHVSQTATISWELDVWPSLGHCASAWAQVQVGGRTVWQKYNRSCCSCCRCWEACLDAPGCHRASRGEMVTGQENFTLPEGSGIIRAYGGDDQADRSHAKATLTFRTIRLFADTCQ